MCSFNTYRKLILKSTSLFFKNTFKSSRFRKRLNSIKYEFLYNRKGGSRTVATSKMELFMVIVDSWKPLTIITKCSILDIAAVLNRPLVLYSCTALLYYTLVLHSCTILLYCTLVLYSCTELLYCTLVCPYAIS